MNTLINKLLSAQALLREESYALFSSLHTFSCALQVAILTALRVKKESAEEILGALDFFRTQSHVFSSPRTVIDIVGTGGDGVGTFNVSTAASLLVARCGVYVAKHGGRAISSKAGSQDVIAALGSTPACSIASAVESLERDHYVYLSAPAFNQGFKRFGLLRKQLGFPTIFNILGPLLHPMQPKRLVIGVYRPDLVTTIAQVLCVQGVEHALVVHALDGLDELSVSAPNVVAEIKAGQIVEYLIDATTLGLPRANVRDVLGGDALENVRIIQGILSGAITGPKADIVVLNAAAGLYVAGLVDNLQEGVVHCRSRLGESCMNF